MLEIRRGHWWLNFSGITSRLEDEFLTLSPLLQTCQDEFLKSAHKCSSTSRKPTSGG
jgi:hypothetical protein